ncbi:hypothetical protein BTJ39_20760 [Izhakiella australiensis]|uniref:Methyl-accepting chemotaxis protein n=1 Tax=Izhakiella australiensis TaxID=1926881 RepID=A0A1S8YE83_9GAMM|nr:methyl-accepting chemotaxis protein [Izhakiella australiensis]OON37033.1 hypothetical protein BTJ39_20760 [Izhakiella australiensis]
MKIRNLGVGTRLGSGFFLVLTLVTGMAAIGIFRISTIMHETERVTGYYLVNERLASEWLSIIDANAALGLSVMATKNDGIKSFASGRMKKNSERASQLQKQLDSSVSSERGRQLLSAIAEKRTAYVTLRAEIMQASEQGNEASVNEAIKTRMLPSMGAYSDSVKAFVEYERFMTDNCGDTIQNNGMSAIRFLIFLGIFAIAAGGMLAWLITRSITRPLQAAVQVAREVASGNLAINVVVDSRDQLGQLMLSLREMTGNLRNTVQKVRQGADSITLAAAEISSGNTDLASRTEEQAASIVQTAATMEEFTSTIDNTAANTERAKQYVSATSSVVTQNGAVMTAVSARMQEIYQSSSKMSDIIQVIDGIAFQTNILALNAAVEAARAGESGRGFAVVAGEVRTLAQRSASAAREIKVLIDDTVARIASGRSLVEQADGGMGEVINNVQHMTQLIDEIAQASREQSDGIAQINIAMGQIDTTTQQNASLVEESAAAAASMQEQSLNLQSIVSVFRLDEAGREHDQPALSRTVQPALL